MPDHRARARLWPAVALILAATGCCSTFERDWKAAQCFPVPPDNLAGLWEGNWESCTTGHHGRLRAIITRCGPNEYRARYHATFFAVIPYAYETRHSAWETPEGTQFQGQTDLGWLAGGNYSYTGAATGDRYEAYYSADRDRGIFRMRRVGASTIYLNHAPPFENEVPPAPTLGRGPASLYEDPVTLEGTDVLPPRPPQ